MTRVALLGCGRIARYFHLPVLAGLPDVELVVTDPDPDARAHAASAAPGAEVHADWRAVVGRDDVDAVVATVPTHLHVEVGVAALEHGRHLYLEKPVATDADGARALLAAHAAAGPGVVAMAGLNLRLHPLYDEARRLLAQGAVGRVVAVRTTFAAAPRALPDWKQARATGGGALLDLASHHVDLVRHLFGEVERVYAEVRSLRTEGDTATLTLHVADGPVVQSVVCLAAVQQDRVEVVGDRGELVLDRYRHGRPVVLPAPSGDGRVARARSGARLAAATAAAVRGVVAPRPDPSFATALGAFVRAASTGTPAAPSLLDGVRSLDVVLAAERSAAEGAPVAVEPTAPEPAPAPVEPAP